MRVQLPFAADRVVAHVWSGSKQPIAMQALNAAGAAVGVDATSGQSTPAAPETLEVRASGITTLLFAGGEREGTLVDLCIYKGDTKKEGDTKGGGGHSADVSVPVNRRMRYTAPGNCGCG
jgi:hypothetical protein